MDGGATATWGQTCAETTEEDQGHGAGPSSGGPSSGAARPPAARPPAGSLQLVRDQLCRVCTGGAAGGRSCHWSSGVLSSFFCPRASCVLTFCAPSARRVRDAVLLELMEREKHTTSRVCDPNSAGNLRAGDTPGRPPVLVLLAVNTVKLSLSLQPGPDDVTAAVCLSAHNALQHQRERSCPDYFRLLWTFSVCCVSVVFLFTGRHLHTVLCASIWIIGHHATRELLEIKLGFKVGGTCARRWI